MRRIARRSSACQGRDANTPARAAAGAHDQAHRGRQRRVGLDRRDARRVIGRREVGAPRVREDPRAARAEVELVPALGGQRPDELAVAALHPGLVQGGEDVRRGAAGHAADGLEGELEPHRVGHPPLQMHRHAVGRDDPEADAGHQHHAGGARFRVAREQRLVLGHLAGEVEVVRPGADAGLRHRHGRRGKRAGAVEDDVDALQGGGERRPVLERRHPRRQPELLRQRRDRFGAAAAEHRREARGHRAARHERAHVARSAVDEQRAAHGRGGVTGGAFAACASHRGQPRWGA